MSEVSIIWGEEHKPRKSIPVETVIGLYNEQSATFDARLQLARTRMAAADSLGNDELAMIAKEDVIRFEGAAEVLNALHAFLAASQEPQFDDLFQ